MGSSSQQQPVTTTQTSDPWSGAQPHLTNVMNAGQGLYNSDVGYQPYPGLTMPAVGNEMAAGLTGAGNMANRDLYGSAGVNSALGLAQDMQGSQGLTAGQQNTVIPGLTQNLTGFERMSMQYGDQYNEANAQQNPYLLSQIAANDRRIGDRVNSSMSGSGRYGSGAHTDVLGRSLAEAANPLLAADYSDRKNRALAASQGMMGAMGARGQTLGALSDVYSGGLQRAGQFGQAIPGLNAAQYAGSDRLLGIGDFWRNIQKEEQQQELNKWNQQQARPWEQLARYSGIVGGMGGLGGTKTTQTPSTAVPFSQRIFGGAMAGAGLGSMFAPGIGTGIGALGGAGAGLLSGLF